MTRFENRVPVVRAPDLSPAGDGPVVRLVGTYNRLVVTCRTNRRTRVLLTDLYRLHGDDDAAAASVRRREDGEHGYLRADPTFALSMPARHRPGG